MTLTMQQKQDWKDDIERKVDGAIKTLLSQAESPELRRLDQLAKQRAKESLGIEALYAESERIGRDFERLERRRRKTWRQMLAKVRGGRAGDVRSDFSAQCEVDVEIVRRAMVCREELLRSHAVGRHVLRIQSEQIELLDAVYRATSLQEVRSLWAKFSELLKWEPRDLEPQTLTAAPVSEVAPHE